MGLTVMYYYIQNRKQQGFTIKYREQYSVSSNKMENHLKTYIYIYMIHFTVHLELTEYCKSTVLK